MDDLSQYAAAQEASQVAASHGAESATAVAAYHMETISQPIVTRKDTFTEMIVNKAIVLMEVHGAGEAASYLNHHKVKMEIALRVLSRPAERRKTQSSYI